MKKIIILISIFFYSGCIRYDGVKDFSKSQEYKGTITKIFQDETDHYMYTFYIKTNKDTIEECAQLWPKSWKYAKVGDSIIKPKDTLMIIIKKPNEKFKEFFYKF